jgi:Protein kinase domain
MGLAWAGRPHLHSIGLPLLGARVLGNGCLSVCLQCLPEREAKAITAQMLAGLAYLNGLKQRIIHYDLKPANILFDSLGGVKIAVSVGDEEAVCEQRAEFLWRSGLRCRRSAKRTQHP